MNQFIPLSSPITIQTFVGHKSSFEHEIRPQPKLGPYNRIKGIIE